jgi:anti-anti-sigma regulatory factor
MTLKIEVEQDGSVATIRLIGRIEGEHIAEVERLMSRCASEVALNLQEVRLVDAQVVQFLASCANRGVQLLHCPAYITEWIEQQKKA